MPKLTILDVTMEPRENADIHKLATDLRERARKLGLGFVYPVRGPKEAVVNDLIREVKELERPFIAIVTVPSIARFALYGDLAKKDYAKLLALLMDYAKRLVIRFQSVVLT